MSISYYVYVLYSETYNRYYTGMSPDPEKRLASHNDSRNRGWTKRYAPWKIIHLEECRDKTTALKRERWYKSGAGRDYIKSL